MKQQRERKVKDITGLKFGKLTVLSFSSRENSRTFWKCICDCGSHKIMRTDQLKRNNISCGCTNKYKLEDLTDMKFGRLIVLERSDRVSCSPSWICKCECGNTMTTTSLNLKSGDTKSCGCLQRETIRNLRFDPSITDEERITKRHVSGYNEWRLSVYRRDKFKCAKCSSNKMPNAHHLKGWKLHPDLRLDIDNGITFCRDCHYKMHSIFGKDMSEQDMKKFLDGDFNDIKLRFIDESD